ncbi:hypothetical protein NMY22_g14717 [Coprinellus aureogranulatus]|nr:hypothetical protein NMY22_g14717 [Coprinellus aureogranulatus]
MASTMKRDAHPFDRTRFDATLHRRFFYAPAFEIYGGVARLYDYSPPGSALQVNIIEQWRKHFIVEECTALKLDSTLMIPSPIIETSGHVNLPTGWLARDREARVTRCCSPFDDKRKKKKGAKATAVKLADELVKKHEAILVQLDNHDGSALCELCRKFDIRNPDTDNEVGEPQQFNLMFQSSIGPTGQHKGYELYVTPLPSPTSDQGHILNVERLIDYKRAPLASAQIGHSFCNEISSPLPRAGFLRVGEFTMAEIEHYVDSKDKSRPRFEEVRDISLVLLDRDVQEADSLETRSMTAGEAVDKGIIANETLGCMDIPATHGERHGLLDAEIHNARVWTDSTVVKAGDGKEFTLTSEVVDIERNMFKQSIRELTPNVSEPSFGLGLNLYTQSFWSREQDVERGVFSLPTVITPTKVSSVLLSAREEVDPLVWENSSKPRKAGVFSPVGDANTSIGKRCAWNDELGTPFGLTIAFASIRNSTATFRTQRRSEQEDWECDTTDQRIGSIDEIIGTATDLVLGTVDWDEACRRLPPYDDVQAVAE